MFLKYMSNQSLESRKEPLGDVRLPSSGINIMRQTIMYQSPCLCSSLFYFEYPKLRLSSHLPSPNVTISKQTLVIQVPLVLVGDPLLEMLIAGRQVERFRD